MIEPFTLFSDIYTNKSVYKSYIDNTEAVSFYRFYTQISF